MTVVRYPFKLQNFTRPGYRCGEIALISVIAFVVSTLIAQVVLTLRFIDFDMGRLRINSD